MCELREAIAPVLEAGSEALGNKGVQLVLDIPRKIVCRYSVPEYSECLLILFSNAVEALSNGGEIRH
jgi:hypothetical protein